LSKAAGAGWEGACGLRTHTSRRAVRAHRRRRWPGGRGAPRARREGRERPARAGWRQGGGGRGARGGACAQGDANQSINFKLCLRAPPPSGGRPPQSARDLGYGRSREPGAASEHWAEEQRAAPAPGPAGARPARGPQPPSRASSDRQPVFLPAQLVLPSATTEPADMSFPQLGYPQYLSAAGPGAYGGERPGVLAAAAAAAAAASSGRPGTAELGAGAGAAAVTSVLGMYAAAGPYAGAPNYSAFLPYAADLSLFSQMVSAPASRASSWPAPTGDHRAWGHRERLAQQRNRGSAGSVWERNEKGPAEGIRWRRPLSLGTRECPEAQAVTTVVLGGWRPESKSGLRASGEKPPEKA
jgi:hypothetical protein